MMILIGILIVVVAVNTYLQVQVLQAVREYSRKLDALSSARQAFRDGTAQLRTRLDKRFGVRNGDNN